MEPVLWDYGADLDVHSKGQYQSRARWSWAPPSFPPGQVCVSGFPAAPPQGLPLTPLTCSPSAPHGEVPEERLLLALGRQCLQGSHGGKPGPDPHRAPPQKPHAVAAGGGQCASGHAAGHRPDWLAEVRPCRPQGRSRGRPFPGGSKRLPSPRTHCPPWPIQSGPQSFPPFGQGEAAGPLRRVWKDQLHKTSHLGSSPSHHTLQRGRCLGCSGP